MDRMTVTLRRLITWLLLAALPWQGVAASAMVLCQTATHSALALAQEGPRMSPVSRTVQPVALAIEHHAAHSGHHGHHDGHHGEDAHGAPGEHVAVTPGDPATGLGGHGLQADADHHCGACSMCSHALALPETPRMLHGALLPEGPVAAALPLPGSRVAALPDKPPRA